MQKVLKGLTGLKFDTLARNALSVLASAMVLASCTSSGPTAPQTTTIDAPPSAPAALTGKPTVTITASATVVPLNTLDTISYSETGASSPCLSNWGGGKPASGTEIFVVPAPGYTFSLACSNSAGTTTASVTVTVGPSATICVSVTGLPAGTQASVSLASPRFAAKIYTQGCFSVVPATYILTASAVTAPDGTVYIPTPALVTFIVITGSKMNSTVTYSAQALPVVRISGISGVTNSGAGIANGLVAMPTCGTAYNGMRVINNAYNVYQWIIAGQNFGSATGTVLLGGQAVRVVNWQNGQITIDPTLPWGSTPASMTFQVRTAAGLVTAVQNIQVAPAISSRIYAQCTYHVALRRYQMGLLPSTYAYSGYSTIMASYVPKRGDQYEWSSVHTAIVEAVAGPVNNNGTTVYTVTIGEQNADCKNGIDQFVTTFAVKGRTVTAYPKHPNPKLGITTAYYR